MQDNRITRKYKGNKDAFLDCCDYLKSSVSEPASFEVLAAMSRLIAQSKEITNPQTFLDIGESI